jgi:cytochrome c oxidase subunit 4
MSGHHRIVPVKTYVTIFALLMAFTAITVTAAYQDFGPLNTVIALSIALVKATLVVLFFMHVKYGSRLTWAFVVAGFFWLAIMLTLTASDYLSRGW